VTLVRELSSRSGAQREIFDLMERQGRTLPSSDRPSISRPDNYPKMLEWFGPLQEAVMNA
jgi:hypothetical protein